MRRLVLAAFCLAAAGCSLLVSFDPETQPCDPRAVHEADKCLEGYACVDGTCVSTDGGAAGAPDGGP